MSEIIGKIITVLVISIITTIAILFITSKKTTDPDELTRIAEFGDSIEAELWKSQLNSFEIECVIIGGKRSPFTLMVKAADAIKAREILSDGTVSKHTSLY